MSTTAGYFGETILMNLQNRLADYANWDSNVKKNFIARIGTVKAVTENQTAKFPDLEDPKKDKKIDVMYAMMCDKTTRAVQACTFDGDELSSNITTYELNISREKVIKIKENDFINNAMDKEEFVAKGILGMDVALCEYLNDLMIAFIESNKGVNAFTGGKGNVVATETYIQAAYWDATLMAYFERVRQLNDFTSPYLLDGSNLFEKLFVAKAEGKGDMNLYGTLPYYNDLARIDAINSPLLKTYLIESGALALATKSYYPQRVEFKDSWRERYESKILPGVVFDLHYTHACGDGDFYEDQFKLKLKGFRGIAPLGCTATNTGILSFVCGAAS